MLQLKILLNLILTLVLFGCSSSGDNGEVNEAVENSGQNTSTSNEDDDGFFSSIADSLSSEDAQPQEDKPIPTMSDSAKLQASRIIAYIQDLSNSVKAMEARVEILEKAVTLGLTPNSLSQEQVEVDDREITSFQVVEPSRLPSANVEDVSEEAGDFKADMEKAISLFNKGEYGSAYVSFNNIDASYIDSVKQGEPEYWVGRCWYRLKEYQAAKKHFHSYVKKHPTSTRAPMAKYYLAKIDVTMGLPSSAVATLQEIIRDNPNGPAAEASRELIADMNKSL